MAAARKKAPAARGKAKPPTKIPARPARKAASKPAPAAGQTLLDVFSGPTAAVAKLAAALPAKIEAARADLDKTAARMAELKKAGLVYATEHWRKSNGEAKYLYLVHPMKNGDRPSPDYIGCDPVKIAEARAGLSRAREYDDLARHERAIVNALSDVQSDLQRANYHFDYL